MSLAVDVSRIGVVVIGRDEGSRLALSLTSVLAVTRAVVYVDSGSRDGSAQRARQMGVDVVELDPTQPFSAARARNAGVARLLECDPDLEAIQFVDGDCELVAGWLERAAAEMSREEQLAVVCGRRRERERERSIYHRLYDMEWDVRPGDDHACGGDALISVEAFRAVGGYRAALVAGEEPELCVRLRASGWRVRRLAAEMTIHDAGRVNFAAWWLRARRAGFAFAEGRSLHGDSPARHWVRESRSIWFWGLTWPAIIVVAGLLTGAKAGVLLGAYAALWLRIFRAQRRWVGAAADAALYATFCVLGKFPEALGQITFSIAGGSRPDRPLTGAVGESRVPG